MAVEITIVLALLASLLAAAAVHSAKYEALIARHLNELSRLHNELQEAHKTIEKLALAHKERAQEFVPEEEAWPSDVQEALMHFPPELGEPTRQWILQQRRLRIGWDLIRSKVMPKV
jgi:hypothetical protein